MSIAPTTWLFIRHAPLTDGNRLTGRTDAPCVLPDKAVLDAIRDTAGAPDHLAVSPASRCRHTAAALFADLQPDVDDRLREQDFGKWDGLPYDDIPDPGPMSNAALADHAAPGGESFTQLCERVALALTGLPVGHNVVVAHAGTVRAALALALEDVPAALSFEIEPLSITLIRALGANRFSVSFVNRLAR